MSESEKIDSVDKKILDIILNDARASLTDIAEEVDVSSSTVRNRMNKLKKIKVIRRFITEVDWRKLGFDVQAMLFIQVKLGTSQAIWEELQKIDEVLKVWETTGQATIIAIVKSKNMNEFYKLLSNKIEKIEGIEKIDVSFILKET